MTLKCVWTDYIESPSIISRSIRNDSICRSSNFATRQHTKLYCLRISTTAKYVIQNLLYVRRACERCALLVRAQYVFLTASITWQSQLYHDGKHTSPWQFHWIGKWKGSTHPHENFTGSEYGREAHIPTKISCCPPFLSFFSCDRFKCEECGETFSTNVDLKIMIDVDIMQVPRSQVLRQVGYLVSRLQKIWHVHRARDF